MKNIHKLLRVALVGLIALAAQVVFAQDRARAHCDGQDPRECYFLAAMYRSESYGIPEIPNDLPRSDALVKTAIDGAIKGCSGADYDLCTPLIDENIQPTTPLGTSRYTMPGRVQAYLSGTEAGCAEGDPFACKFRSAIYADLDSQLTEIGLSLKTADGASPSDAFKEIVDERRHYGERAHSAAKAKLTALRRACTNKNTQDCATLGSLLFSFGSLRNSPDEHLAHLLRTCSAAHPKSCSILGFAAAQITDAAEKTALKQQLLADCHAGNGEMCMVRVRLARSSDPLDINATYEQACLHGSGAGCLARAINHLQEFDREQDIDMLATATQMLGRACDLKTSKACHLLEHLPEG